MATKDGVFALEVAVVVLLMCTYLLGEIVRLAHWMTTKRDKRDVNVVGLHLRDVAVMLVALGGSLVIYLCFVYATAGAPT